MSLRWRVAGAAAALGFLAACAPPPAAEEATVPGGLAAATEEERLLERSASVLAAIRDRDPRAIARFIHPVKGLRLSPHAFVDLESDQHFTAEQFVVAWSDPAMRRWGTEDGSGEPLEMTSADYFARYVYDADFMAAEQTAVDHRLGRGNTIDNASEVYPGARVVEYHFAGFDPQFEGLDWKSLRLVFEPADGKWYLVGLIHDQWTI